MPAPSSAASLPVPAAAARPWLRIVLAIGAIVLVAGAGALLIWALLPPAPPPRPMPFGVGVPEAAPRTGALARVLAVFQSAFYDGLRGAVSALKESGAALPALIGLGFAYGVFHAAGPGHGKAVIAAYLVADGRAAWKGFSLSLAAALLQALVAIALVLTAGLLLAATAREMDTATRLIETASFAAVAAMGAVVVWRKAGTLATLLAGARGGAIGPGCGDGCAHLPDPTTLSRMRGLREQAGVVVAAGLRPCAGAIVVLVFALSQGIVWAGVAATLAMALGTALTTGLIATLAVLAKRLALGLAGGRGSGGTLAIGGLELLAGAFVLVLGLALLVGVSQAGVL
ncbi:nickel/cobalt transporter [Salinarimonas rosea]|uniref:nickel/cobalt transporter n=1 Tax=Salinarimonas rosea TaxID=552063 RepID=UPI00040E597F|nr:nickel transporter [Salinarimonas rosea]